MSRNFLSLHPYYEDGPILGRKQANTGFINALFKKDPFDNYHFYVHDPEQLMTMWSAEPAAQPLLQRGALQAFSRIQLEKRLKIVPYTVCHLSDPMTEFAAVCQVRNALSSKLFPVTAVNHTISYIDYAKTTLGHIWQGCTPRDAIGCTSATSLAVMDSWYHHARRVRDLPDDWYQPQLKIIPLGVPDPDLGDNKEMRQTFRESLQLAPETVMILLYGRISIADKMDVRPLLNALRRIRTNYPEHSFFLYIAGSMNDGDSIKEELIHLAQAWDIPFTIEANPSRIRKKELFAAADMFVSPVDNIQETFGLTLVEAAQSGLPVIASHWDGYKDIVLHGETGFLIPTFAPTETPALDILSGVLFNTEHQLFRSQQTAMHIPSLEQALLQLLSDVNLRKSMGIKAKKRAAKYYTFDKVVDEWILFWDELEKMPISEEQERRIRSAKHPYILDFGKTFAVYASHHLNHEIHLQSTALGRACLQRKAPWNNYGLAAVNMTESLIHSLIKRTLDGCTVADLLYMRKEYAWEKRFSEETVLAHIYWLLKQDLVECTLPVHH